MFSALGIATGAGRFLLGNPILLALVGIVVAYQGGYWLGSRDGRAVASVDFQRQVAKLNSEADARVLEAIKADMPDVPVVIRGVSATQYQTIMDVLTAVGRVGITQVGLATQAKK